MHIVFQQPDCEYVGPMEAQKTLELIIKCLTLKIQENQIKDTAKNR